MYGTRLIKSVQLVQPRRNCRRSGQTVSRVASSSVKNTKHAKFVANSGLRDTSRRLVLPTRLYSLSSGKVYELHSFHDRTVCCRFSLFNFLFLLSSYRSCTFLCISTHSYPTTCWLDMNEFVNLNMLKISIRQGNDRKQECANTSAFTFPVIGIRTTPNDYHSEISHEASQLRGQEQQFCQISLQGFESCRKEASLSVRNNNSHNFLYKDSKVVKKKLLCRSGTTILTISSTGIRKLSKKVPLSVRNNNSDNFFYKDSKVVEKRLLFRSKVWQSNIFLECKLLRSAVKQENWRNLLFEVSTFKSDLVVFKLAKKMLDYVEFS